MLHEERRLAGHRGLDDLVADAQGADRREALGGLHEDRAVSGSHGAREPRHAQTLHPRGVAVDQHVHLVRPVPAHVHGDVAPDPDGQAGGPGAARDRVAELGDLLERGVPVVPHAVEDSQHEVVPRHPQDDAVRGVGTVPDRHDRPVAAALRSDPHGDVEGREHVGGEAPRPAHHLVRGLQGDRLVRQVAPLEGAALLIEVHDSPGSELGPLHADRIQLNEAVLLPGGEGPHGRHGVAVPVDHGLADPGDVALPVEGSEVRDEP